MMEELKLDPDSWLQPSPSVREQPATLENCPRFRVVEFHSSERAIDSSNQLSLPSSNSSGELQQRSLLKLLCLAQPYLHRKPQVGEAARRPRHQSWSNSTPSSSSCSTTRSRRRFVYINGGEDLVVFLPFFSHTSPSPLHYHSTHTHQQDKRLISSKALR